MRSPATTAMLLLQRFYARRSLARHSRAGMAAAAVFVAAKVEEAHARPHAVLEAAHAVTSGARRLPFAEGSPEARPARAALLQAERVLLAALDFDAAVEQPYPIVRAALQAWRRDTAGPDPKEKRPELAALERAAASLIFAACVRRRRARAPARSSGRSTSLPPPHYTTTTLSPRAQHEHGLASALHHS